MNQHKFTVYKNQLELYILCSILHQLVHRWKWILRISMEPPWNGMILATGKLLPGYDQAKFGESRSKNEVMVLPSGY